MNRFYHFLLRSLLILCITTMLFSCSKINQNDFNKVKPNMTMEEVITILGTPDSININVIDPSGSTTAVWKDRNCEIDIQFLNDCVSSKVFIFNHPNKHKP